MGDHRRYLQKIRAEKVAATRDRIVEAAVQLHRTIGPARATISAIAERAGVGRPTVYSHFPDLGSLFMACSMKGMSEDPPPDPSRWREISDPRRRLHEALMQTYGYFRRNASLMSHMNRDRSAVPELERLGSMMQEQNRYTRQVLAEGLPATDRSVLDAALRHVLDFDTWRTLCRDGGLDDRTAALLGVMFVERALTVRRRRRGARSRSTSQSS